MKHKKRLLIYKIAILLFIAIIFVWPQFLRKNAEIDSRALALSIGIDVNNDDDRGEVLASAQIVVPVIQGQQSGKQEVFFGTGRTLSEALDYINVKIGRVLDFSQVGIIVFSEESAKKGIMPDLKYLINNKVRAESTLFIAYDTEARELLKKANSLTEEATSSLNNFLKFNAQSTYMPNINLLDFLSDSSCTDKSSFIPILNIMPQESITLTDGSENGKIEVPASVQGSAQEGKGEQKLNEIKDVDRVYLFKDGKLISKLTKEEAKGLIWHNKEVHFGLITLENIDINGKIVKYLPCELRGKAVRSNVSFEKNIPTIIYRFKLQLNSEDLHEVNEKYDVKKFFSRAEINTAIKKAIEIRVKKDVEACLKRLAEADIDALRIRQNFYKFKNKEYKQYIKQNEGFLENVEVKYKFDIKFY